ncbi:MAG: ABC transporter permease [Lachnospiraceae bacterium]|nr:ABC transporter permease [Lachnospiraceae bacterium]
MSLISFIRYDIKRLFGHGKTAILAVLSPIPVLLLFASFLIPFLSADTGSKLSCAIFNEDTTERFTKVVDYVVAPEVKNGTAVVYPVQDFDTGIRLVQEGKVAAFFYIPAETYSRSMHGEVAELQFYYSREHAFEAEMFLTSMKSTLSVFGQGIRIVYLAADLATEKGLTTQDILNIWEEGSVDLINVHLHRGRIIGMKGVFTPGNDYYLRFGMGALFAICAYFVSFPVMYLTGLDVSNILKKRSLPQRNLTLFYFARLISGTVLILLAFSIMYPIARGIRKFPVKFALSVIPGMLLCALTFSALAILIGAVFHKGYASLWVGLYFGFISAVGIVFSVDSDLPAFASLLIRISPLRACVSIFSNAMFQDVSARYQTDIMILALSFLVFFLAGFLVYRERGKG